MATIDDIKEQLIALKAEGHTYSDLRSFALERGVRISLSGLKERCKQWGAVNPPTPVTDDLVDQIKELYLHNSYSDQEIANEIVASTGCQLTARQIKTIRLNNQLERRVQKADPQQTLTRKAATYAVVDHLVNEGPGRNWGSRWARNHLRHAHGIPTQLSDVQESLKDIVPDRVEARRRKERRRRREAYTTAGPNEVWSLDGHDKLSRYGFQIYAAIDAYSWKVL